MRPPNPVFLLALLLLAPRADAGEAVVLSGGGSLGFAHVGALIGIERRGHNPEMVLGTSMGAIVGALYAAGYQPDSIWNIMEAQDWRGIFTPLPAVIGPARTLRYPAIHLQRGGGAFILRGFVSDWRINRELTRLLFPASAAARGDFDRLPRRYRSVAADLEDGSLVPLANGDLARAVRASMASPGVFSPVRWDSRILTDGGVNDYLPVDEARRLGADFVIAVDALKPLARIHALDAILVADRSLRLTVVRARAGGARPDVLVLPDLNPAQTGFNYPVDPSPIMKAGLTAALREVNPDSEGIHATSPRPLPAEPVFLGALAVEMPGSPLGPFVWRAFRRFPNARYDSRRVFDTVDRLYETGCFDGVWPSVEDTIHADRPSWIVRGEGETRVSLAGAAGFDNDRGGRIWGSLHRTDVFSSTPVQLAIEGSANGVERGGALSLRIPSLAPPTAWSMGGAASESRIPFLVPPGAAESAEVHHAGGWVGAEWLRVQPAVEGAVSFRGERITSDLGPSGSSFGPLLRLGVVPRLVEIVGTAPSVEGEVRFGDVRYRRARIKGSVSRSVGALDVAVLGDGEIVSGGAPLDAAPAMGTEFLIPALRWGERRGKERAIAGMDFGYSFPFEGTLRLRLRGGVVADQMRADGTFGRASAWLGGAGLSGIWWTPYGRVEIGGEAGTLGDRRLLVRLGQDF